MTQNLTKLKGEIEKLNSNNQSHPCNVNNVTKQLGKKISKGTDLNNTIQFSSVAQLCPTLCDSVDCSMPGFPVHHQLPDLDQTHVHLVGDAIQPIMIGYIAGFITDRG